MFGNSHEYSIVSEPTIDYNDMEGNQYGNLMESFRQSVKTTANHGADIESSYHEADSHIKQDAMVPETESRNGTFTAGKVEPFIQMASNDQSMEYYNYGNNG